jgi:uroporphyrinogen-III synthase
VKGVGAAPRRVLVTRRWPELVAKLAAAGIVAVEVPAIETAPPADTTALDAALHRLSGYDWLVFTSANAVEAVVTRLGRLRLPPPTGVSLASVGPATSHAIESAWPGVRVEVQPESDFRAAALVEAFAGRALRGRRFLLPVSDRAADTVERALVAGGARVDRVVAYRTMSAMRPDRLRAEMAAGIGGVVFASPSAVDSFRSAAGREASSIPAVCIGPTTTDAAHAAGLAVAAVAPQATVDGVAEAVAGLWR